MMSDRRAASSSAGVTGAGNAVVPYGPETQPTGRGTYIIWRYEPQP